MSLEYQLLFNPSGKKLNTTAPEPICMECKHLHENKPGQWGFRCDAFPDGIPDEIFVTGEVDHTKPFDGDKGIQFEAKNDAS